MTPKIYRGLNVSLLVPCFNEELTIAKVVKDFLCALPELNVYVFDNNSSDKTAAVAQQTGANVVSVLHRGKGNVVRRMFADVEADIYVMVDGDATYEAGAIKRVVDKLLDDRLDMVVGTRVTDTHLLNDAYRQGHQFGNKLLTQSVVQIFGGDFTDMLSGYRVFSRRYAKSFPALARGFEIETELTVHALELRMPIGEVPTQYGVRPEGSASKLSTYRDGIRILKTICRLYVTERPLAFYFALGLVLLLLAMALGLPIIVDYLETGFVPRFPTAILASSIVVLGILSILAGVLLDNVTRARHEIKRLIYLSIPAPRPDNAE